MAGFRESRTRRETRMRRPGPAFPQHYNSLVTFCDDDMLALPILVQLCNWPMIYRHTYACIMYCAPCHTTGTH
jgi:hypothetical protein